VGDEAMAEEGGRGSTRKLAGGSKHSSEVSNGELATFEVGGVRANME